MIVLILYMYQFIKPIMDDKMSILEEYGAFELSILKMKQKGKDKFYRDGCLCL